MLVRPASSIDPRSPAARRTPVPDGESAARSRTLPVTTVTTVALASSLSTMNVVPTSWIRAEPTRTANGLAASWRTSKYASPWSSTAREPEPKPGGTVRRLSGPKNHARPVRERDRIPLAHRRRESLRRHGRRRPRRRPCLAAHNQDDDGGRGEKTHQRQRLPAALGARRGRRQGGGGRPALPFERALWPALPRRRFRRRAPPR